MVSNQFVSVTTSGDRLKILFLAPQPFYQERGSPIANDMVLQVLSARSEEVDVVTYSEGVDVYYDQIDLYRIKKLAFLANIKPGFSWQKIICDFLMVLKVIPLILRKRYHLVHAVEESVFIALVLKILLNIPYIYDMDSSIPEQMVEKYPKLAKISFFLDFWEKIAVKNAQVVVPVCQAIANRIARYQPTRVELIPDVSLLKERKTTKIENLRQELNLTGQILMYVGNLESYQGIDLLLDSMAMVCQQTEDLNLVIIGGDPDDIAKYQQQAQTLGITAKVHFIGMRSPKLLDQYLQQADILVSPRIKGKNTPMKIYSYLDSGKPVVATDLATHTQVIEAGTTILAAPEKEGFAEGILTLTQDKNLQRKIGQAGKQLIQAKYTPQVFQRKFNRLYDSLKAQLL